MGLRGTVSDMQPFDATFGKSKQRKRPRLATDSLSELLTHSQSTTNECAALASHPEL